MKSRSHTFQFSSHLREVRLRNGQPGQVPESEATEREQAAYERGRRDGERALSNQLLTQRGDLATLEQGVLKSLGEAVPDLLRKSESVLIELSLELARKIVAGMAISPELVEAVVREALSDLEQNLQYQVYLNPEDIDLLNRIQSPLLSQSTPTLQFHPSPEVSRGGCLVKTPFGVIDARREVKIEALQKALSS